MNARQVFEKMMYSFSHPIIEIDYILKFIKLHEIDDETMCEGYAILIPTSYLEKIGWKFNCPESCKLDNCELFMEVKYEDWYPAELIVYDSQASHVKLFSCRITEDLRNPFGFVHYDINTPGDAVQWFNTIVIEGLKTLMDMTVYGIVMNL